MYPLTPKKDNTLEKLINYVKDFLNNSWNECLIVRSTRVYDAFLVSNDNYPLLKLYRRYERNSLNDNLAETELTFSYCLLNTQIHETPGIARWVSTKITQALQQFKFEHPNQFNINDKVTTRYRTLIQLGEIVYQVDIDFSIDNETPVSCSNDLNSIC